MPIYEYECQQCGKHHEIMQKITERAAASCPSCGGAMKKKISNTSFVLKGSGWYMTDYADKTRKGPAEDAGKKDTAADTAKKEVTKETKSESTSASTAKK